MVRRRAWLAAGALAALAAAGVGFYAHTAAFQRRAEAYVLGRMGGASAAAFHVNLFPLRITMRGLTMPGVTVAQVDADVEWRSLLAGHPRLRRLELEGPAVHLNTGGPLPWLGAGGVDVTVAQLDARQGQLYLADRALPWELHLRNVALQAGEGRRGVAGEIRFRGDKPRPSDSAIRFLWQGPDIRLEQVRVQMAGGKLEGQGWVRDVRRPAATLAYRATGDAASLLPGVMGKLQAAGTLAWSEATWSASAAVQATGLGERRVPGTWSGTAQVLATPAGLQIAAFALDGLGAKIRGAGDSPGWRGYVLTAAVQGLPLEAGRAFLPADVPRLASRASGTVRINTAGRQAEADLQFEVAPGAGLPLAGGLQVRYAPGEVRLAQVQLQIADTSLQGGGQVDGDAVQGQFALHSPEIGRMRPLIAALARRLMPRATLPDFGGGLDLRGSVHGRLAAPTLTGTLALAHAHWGAETADSLAAAGTISREAVNLSRLDFRSGQQHIVGQGVVGLDDYRVTAGSALDAAATIEGLSLARVQGWLGTAYPVTGVLSARARLQGTRAHPQGAGSLALADLRWGNQAARGVSASFTLRQDRLSSSDLALTLARTRVTGGFQLGLADHTFQLHLASNAVQLREIALLQSQRLALRGQARFDLAAQGRLDQPQSQTRADLVFTTSGLAGGGESLGDVGAQAHLANGVVTFRAADILPNGSFNLSGTAAAAAPYALEARLALRDYDFDAWLRRFTPADLTGHSHISGQASIRGPLADPRQLTADVDLDPVELSLSGLVLHNQGAVRLRAGQNGITLEPAHFIGRGPQPGSAGRPANARGGSGAPVPEPPPRGLAEDTDFTFSGAARLGATRRDPVALSGAMQGTINLALVHSLYAPLRASGQAQVAATLAGTVAQPQVRGQVQLVHASLAEENSPIAFDDIEGLMRLDGRRLQVERLTAHTGGGTLAVAGFVVKTAGGASFDLSAEGRNLRLRSQGISATGDAQLRFNGQGGNALLSGDAQLNRVGLDRDFDLAVFIASTQAPGTPPDPDSLLNHIRLNVHLVTGPQVAVATNLAHLQLQADIQLRGTLADPSVLGRASASEGRVLFAGNEYQVSKAQVQFVNPFRIEPLLDVGLRTTVQQYDVTLNLSGPVDKLAITYRSDPPLSSSDVVALLATGQPTQASASLSAASNYAPSEQLLGEALNNLVAGRLQRLFGITQVQVNPNAGALGTTGSGGTVTVQQQVARNLKLTYTQNLASSAQDIVQVDWTISRFLGLTLSRDQFGLYGLKFTFRHRKR